MFADDIVVFGGTADRLEELLDAIWEWANTWEMLVGHAKCGAMLFGATRENANYREREWILQGKPIAVVEEYTYLPRSEDCSRCKGIGDDECKNQE